MSTIIFIVIIVIITFGYLFEKILDFINHKTWTEKLPDDLKEFYDEEKYNKAFRYNKIKYNFSFVHDTFGFIIIMVFFAAGGFGLLNDWLSSMISNRILLALAFYGILFLCADIMSIPFSLYHLFVIEEKFGFNKTTVRTYILDKLKTYLLTLLLGAAIISLILWLVFSLGNNFWIFAYLAMMIISLLINVFYGSLILPLFNKLKPLEDGELRISIENYAKTTLFPLSNIYVMDGSKRSSKANAFFTGLWKSKKIILFDTLIQKHSSAELVAVLAHEVGHYKKKHVTKGMIISAIESFFMFFILSLFIFEKSLSQAFGANEIAIHINLLAFAMLYQPVSILLSLFSNYLSRRHEYEADRFAITTTNGSDLPAALKKLSIDHLSNLKPNPVYVFFYYSHPPLLKRLKAMSEVL